jgi:hypothetical protein
MVTEREAKEAGVIFFLTMYAHRHILLVFINIIIQSWYRYKQHNTRRTQTVVLLQTTITATIKHTRPSPLPEKKKSTSSRSTL